MATKKKPAKKKAAARPKKSDVLLPIDQWIAEAKAESKRQMQEAKKRRSWTMEQIVAHARSFITKEEMDRSPRDGSYNIDHYLYGAPKKTLND